MLMCSYTKLSSQIYVCLSEEQSLKYWLAENNLAMQSYIGGYKYIYIFYLNKRGSMHFSYWQKNIWLSCVFHWGEASTWPLLHYQWIVAVMVVLLEVSPISTPDLCNSASDHQVLGHLPYQGPPPPITQFYWVASSRKSPGCSKLLPFKN